MRSSYHRRSYLNEARSSSGGGSMLATRRRSALPVPPIAASLVVGLLFSITVYAQTPQDSSGPGRVAVTISVEGLRIPAVQVELRDVARNIVVARTTEDAIGQVTF